MTRQELIDRLGAAKEGSRELDARIWELAAPKQFAISQTQAMAFSPRGLSEEAQTEAKAGKARRMAPHYTTSLDAALTLVPPQMQWHVNASANPGEFRAEVDWGQSIWAATPALALCIACLKARGDHD